MSHDRVKMWRALTTGLAELPPGAPGFEERFLVLHEFAKKAITRPGESHLPEAQKKGAAENQARARRRQAEAMAIIVEIQGQGITSYRAIAAELENRAVRRIRGGQWTARLVSKICRSEGIDGSSV